MNCSPNWFSSDIQGNFPIIHSQLILSFLICLVLYFRYKPKTLFHFNGRTLSHFHTLTLLIHIQPLTDSSSLVYHTQFNTSSPLFKFVYIYILDRKANKELDPGILLSSFSVSIHWFCAFETPFDYLLDWSVFFLGLISTFWIITFA